MQISVSSFLLAASTLFALSAAAPAEVPAAVERSKRADCVVNALIINSWNEDGLHRFQTAFSTSIEGYDLSQACNIWNNVLWEDHCASIGNNVQCYWNSGANSWVVDENEVLGPAGDSVIDCVVTNFLREWEAATGCGTG